MDTCFPLASSNNTIFNLKNLAYISSTGVGAVFKLTKLAQQNKYKIILCCTPPSILEIIKLTRLENIFTIAQDLDQAINILIPKQRE